MTKLYNIDKIYFKNGYITGITQDINKPSSTLVPSVNAVQEAIENIVSDEYIITTETQPEIGDVIDVPFHDGIQVVYLGTSRNYYTISLINNQPTKTIVEAQYPIRVVLNENYIKSFYRAPVEIKLNTITFTPTELLIEKSLNVNDIYVPDTIIINSYDKDSLPSQKADTSTVEDSGVQVCNPRKSSNFKPGITPTYTSTEYEEVKIVSKGFGGYYSTTNKTVKYKLDTNFIFEYQLQDTQFIPFVEITNSNCYIDQVIYPTVLPLNKYIFINDEINADVYIPFNSKVVEPLKTVEGIKIFRLDGMTEGVREQPQEEYNLISRENYLMSLPYRHKMNIMFDMNYFRNNDKFDQTYKILFEKIEDENNLFKYKSITRMTPKTIYLSSKLYNDDIDSLYIKTTRSFIELGNDTTFKYITKTDLIYCKKENEDDVFVKPKLYLVENEDYIMVNSVWTKYDSSISEDSQIRVCYTDIRQMFLSPDYYGYVQITGDANNLKFKCVYCEKDIDVDLNPKFLCFNLEKDQYYVVSYEEAKTSINNYMAFKYGIDTNQGTFINKLEDDETKYAKTIFVSENIKGLEIQSRNNCKVIYYNICNLSKVIFDSFDTNNEIFIDIDASNIKLDQNLTVGKIHFIDDSLDCIYENGVHIHLGQVISSETLIVVNKKKGYDLDRVAEYLDVDVERIKEEILSPCFRLH